MLFYFKQYFFIFILNNFFHIVDMGEFSHNHFLCPLDCLLWLLEHGVYSAPLLKHFPEILQRTVVLGSSKNLKTDLEK